MIQIRPLSASRIRVLAEPPAALLVFGVEYDRCPVCGTNWRVLNIDMLRRVPRTPCCGVPLRITYFPFPAAVVSARAPWNIVDGR